MTSQTVFRMALRSIFKNKMRTALTMLGIVIGVGAVIVMVAIGNGAQAQIKSQISGLGTNLIVITAGSVNTGGASQGAQSFNRLTVDDVDAIKREATLLAGVSPVIVTRTQVVGGTGNWRAEVDGVSPDFFSIRDWATTSGDLFTDEDVRTKRTVLLLGATVAKNLWPDSDPVGQEIRLGKTPFTVVGVLAPKGQTQYGWDQDDWVLVPYTTAQKKLLGKGHTWLDDILCSAVTPEAVNPAIDQVIDLLRQRHHIRAGEEDDFNIRRPDELIKAHIAAAQTLAVLLMTIACISLLVGGIGIMNVMLATVAQRTREIGLRMAVGARPVDVQVQFLGEAALLSLVGGALGILLSMGSSYLFEDFLGWELTIPIRALVLAVGFSVGVGLLFGLYPARRASQMDPIEALRHE